MTDRGILKINIWLRNVLQGIFAMPVEERNTSLIVFITYISFNKPCGQDTEPETDGRPTFEGRFVRKSDHNRVSNGFVLGHDFVLPLDIGDDSINIGNDYIPDLPTVETVKTDTASTDTKGIRSRTCIKTPANTRT